MLTLALIGALLRSLLITAGQVPKMMRKYAAQRPKSDSAELSLEIRCLFLRILERVGTGKEGDDITWQDRIRCRLR